MWRSLLLLLVMANSFCAQSQSTFGARSEAIAGASLSVEDVWAVHNNQAAMAWVENFSAGAFYSNRFGLDELSDKGAVAALPLGGGVLGAEVQSFGYSLYNRSKFGLAYAMKFSEKFSSGIQINYYSIQLGEGYGSTGGVSFEGGFLYKMNEQISLAAHLVNPTRSKLSDFNDERLPSLLKAGGIYRFSEKVFLATEIWKPSDNDFMAKSGIEYQFAKTLSLSAGYATGPSLFSFGFGWKWKSLRIDAASNYHQVLGFSPYLALTYSARND